MYIALIVACNVCILAAIRSAYLVCRIFGYTQLVTDAVIFLFGNPVRVHRWLHGTAIFVVMYVSIHSSQSNNSKMVDLGWFASTTHRLRYISLQSYHCAISCSQLTCSSKRPRSPFLFCSGWPNQCATQNYWASGKRTAMSPD